MRADRAFLDGLAEADRAWQREKARAFWWRAVPWLLGFVLAAFAADAFLQLSAGVRLAWIIVGVVGALSALAAGWNCGWMRRNPAERTARFLEERDPSLGSRLINALQLADQTEDLKIPEPTRNIAARAVVGYGEELRAVNLPHLAVTGESARRLKQAGIAALGFCALLAIFYPVACIVAPRFFDPWGDHPPYAFTRVEIVDPGAGGADLIYGGALPVRVKWSGHEPSELYLSVYPKSASSPIATLPMIRDGDNGFVQEIGDVRGDFSIVAHSKNFSFYSQRRDARVILTPKIEKAFLEITPPAYTGLKAQEQPFTFQSANALEGSRLRFRLQSNRPLEAGAIEITRNGKTQSIALTPDGDKEVSGEFTIDDDAKLRFRVTDVDGIPSDDQPEALISVLHDLPPAISIVAPEQDGFAAVDYRLNAKIEASDDYGVRTIRIHRALNGVYSAPRVYNISDVETFVPESLPFDFSDLGVKPGDQVSMFAEAIDTAPSPHLSRSQTITLSIISEQDYNQYLRQQEDVRALSDKYNALLQQFRDLRNQQAKLAADAAALRSQATDKKSAMARLSDFDALTARQNELNQRLNQLAQRMEKFVRPNPVYDFEKDLQAQLTSEAQQIRQSTDMNDAALDQLARQTSLPDGSRSLTPGDLDLLQAEAKAQAASLGARDEEMAKSVQQPLEKLSQFHDLVNDFNLFQQLFHLQQALAQQIQAYQNKGPLDREDQLALKDLAAQQEEIRNYLQQLPDALRADAKAAQSTFPKAASSANTLADAIESRRFEPLAKMATDAMLNGDGAQGALLAQRLESDMSQLFSECHGSGQDNSDELDQYLHLTLGGGAGQSLQQMRQFRNFGLGSGRFGSFGLGEGEAGASDSSGYSMSAAPESPVLGNEQFSPNGPKQLSKLDGNGNTPGGQSANGLQAPQMDQPDVMNGLNPMNRQADSAHTEGTIEEYRPIVDEYFKTITHQP